MCTGTPRARVSRRRRCCPTSGRAERVTRRWHAPKRGSTRAYDDNGGIMDVANVRRRSFFRPTTTVVDGIRKNRRCLPADSVPPSTRADHRTPASKLSRRFCVPSFRITEIPARRYSRSVERTTYVCCVCVDVGIPLISLDDTKERFPQLSGYRTTVLVTGDCVVDEL